MPDTTYTVKRLATAVSLAAMVAFTAFVPTDSSAATITIGSGMSGGTPGTSTDPNLRVVAGPSDSDFTTAGFNAAVATLNSGGGVAPFITTTHPAWAAPIAGTLYVNPIATGGSEGSTGAYLATFNLPAFTTASLDLDFLSDNLLNGFLLNGNAISTPGGGFSTVTHVDVDDASLFVVGENRLIFRAVDQGGPAAFDFLATVNFTAAPTRTPPGQVPEPASSALLGFGLLALGLARRRVSRQ